MDYHHCVRLTSLIVSIVVSLTGGKEDMCPSRCFCNQKSKIVYCSRRGLLRIPTQSIPSDFLQLNLNTNRFESTVIQRSNFSKFTQLEHLYISECGIEKIEVDTFTDLKQLQWLDISNNQIKVIEDHTFHGLSLKHLFLNGNRNIILRRDSFAGLSTTGLYLQECSLSRLSMDVFVHLNNTLKNLWLNGNELKRIDKKFLPMFNTFHHLRLASNPFHCNCEIKWLKQLYDTHESKFVGAAPPSCLTPTKWRNQMFNQIQLDSFSCQPPYFKNIDAVFKGTNGMLRCTSSGDPAPRLYWIQPSGHSTLYKPSNNESVHFNQAILNISAENTRRSDLSGSYFCVAINDAGNMTFTFNLTWPSSQIGDKVKDQSLQTGGDVTYKTIPANLGSIINDEDSEEIQAVKDLLSSTTQVTNTPTQPVTGKPRVNTKSTNNTAGNVSEIDTEVIKTETMFSLAELIGAIIGTFLCTLIFCFILIPIYFHRRWKNNSSPRHSGGVNKNNLQEVRYLNGMGNHGTQTYNYRDYFDTSGSLKR